DHADLFQGPPIGPGGVRSTTVKTAEQAIRVRSHDSPHVDARIVGLNTRYFARLAPNGNFRIDDVPAGRWNLRVWYRDGWLSTTQVVDVDKKSNKVKVVLPDKVEAEPAPAPAKAPAK